MKLSISYEYLDDSYEIINTWSMQSSVSIVNDTFRLFLEIDV